MTHPPEAVAKRTSSSAQPQFVDGWLAPDCSLARYLREVVFGEVLGIRGSALKFNLRALAAGRVLRCDEATTSTTIALKLFSRKWINGTQAGNRDLRIRLMYREFENLRQARSLGLDRAPRRVVRPLSVNVDLGCMLVEEFVPGPDLCHYICDAAWYGRHDALHERLTQLALLLADLHNRSETDIPGTGDEAVAYFWKVVGQLIAANVMTSDQRSLLGAMSQDWDIRLGRCGYRQVLIHGDATPTQFLFPSQNEIVVIDMEALTVGDRAADIGRIAGELKHLFYLNTGDRWTSEPFIQRFYQDYSAASGIAAGDFADLTERARFYMACSELRIARNNWEGFDHRQRLIDEAARCLAS